MFRVQRSVGSIGDRSRGRAGQVARCSARELGMRLRYWVCGRRGKRWDLMPEYVPLYFALSLTDLFLLLCFARPEILSSMPFNLLVRFTSEIVA